MPDLDPHGEIQQYTPRQTTMVDAFAETKRVATAMMQANPLRNAIVDDGLMRWRGNYGGEFFWVGEFLPEDPVFDKPQRGVIIRRDDSGKHDAFRMYDWNVADHQAGPLRQKVVMLDADGKELLREGLNGGRGWPFESFPMSGDRAFEKSRFPAVNVLDPGLNNWVPLYRGWTAMTGNQWRQVMFVNSGAPAGQPFIGFEAKMYVQGWADGSFQTVEGPVIAKPAGQGLLNFDATMDLKDTVFWGHRDGWILPRVDIRFTSIPGWVTADDAVFSYMQLCYLYGDSTTIEQPEPPPG